MALDTRFPAGMTTFVYNDERSGVRTMLKINLAFLVGTFNSMFKFLSLETQPENM